MHFICICLLVDLKIIITVYSYRFTVNKLLSIYKKLYIDKYNKINRNRNK